MYSQGRNEDSGVSGALATEHWILKNRGSGLKVDLSRQRGLFRARLIFNATSAGDVRVRMNYKVRSALCMVFYLYREPVLYIQDQRARKRIVHMNQARGGACQEGCQNRGAEGKRQLIFYLSGTHEMIGQGLV